MVRESYLIPCPGPHVMLCMDTFEVPPLIAIQSSPVCDHHTTDD